MVSSSSDSDSDESEPIRKIKINIRPKSDIVERGADVNEIKASVEAWRPLGPPTHPSLSRRQSSLSSMSSISFGTPGSIHSNSTTIAGSSVFSNFNASNTIGNHGFGASNMRSSPSCSSLVSEFGNRATLTNFMSTSSRTSSPLAFANISDPVPIAIAIQESIELTVKGHYDPEAKGPKYVARSLGNIKVAFTNAFARGSFGKPATNLRLSLLTTDKVSRYYASRLIRDLEGLAANHSTANPMPSISKTAESRQQTTFETNVFSSKQGEANFSIIPKCSIDELSDGPGQEAHLGYTQFDKDPIAPSNQTNGNTNNKLIEFDMDCLMNQLRKLYDQNSKSKYYNVDVLRYQLAPLKSIDQSPLQVCAYWKIEDDMVKLRVDFKHSSASGFNIERLREINFSVNMSQFFPANFDDNEINIMGFSNKLTSTNSNNNYSGALNMNNLTNSLRNDACQSGNSGHALQANGSDSQASLGRASIGFQQVGAFAAELRTQRNSDDKLHFDSISNFDPLMAVDMNKTSLPQTTSSMKSNSSNNHDGTSAILGSNNSMTPSFITYEPYAHWNNSIKQLTWKFDTLLPYHKSDGFGSLFAKIDFRKHRHLLPSKFLATCTPSSVMVKFLVTDSTLSKINLSLDSAGYRLSLLKKEIRSGRYESEPYLVKNNKTVPGPSEPLI